MLARNRVDYDVVLQTSWSALPAEVRHMQNASLCGGFSRELNDKSMLWDFSPCQCKGFVNISQAKAVVLQ